MRTERARPTGWRRFERSAAAVGLCAVLAACGAPTPAVDVVPGVTVWSDAVATVGLEDEVLAVAAGPDGVVAYGGATRGDVGTIPSQGEADGFVVLLEADGAERWRVPIGDAGDDHVAALAVRGDGVVVAVGTTATTPGGTTRAFAFGLDAATGATLWQRFVGTPEDVSGVAVAVDATGVAFVAGTIRGDLPPAVNQGLQDAFLLRVTPAGDVGGFLMFGGDSSDFAADVVLLPGGDVVLVGTAGSDLPGAVGTGRLFAARFPPSLTAPPTWVVQAGGDDLDVVPGAAAVDPDGAVVVVGQASGQVGADPVLGDYDVFVARLAAVDGAPTFVRQVGTAGYDTAMAVAMDADGRVWASGSSSTFPGGGDRAEAALYVFGADDALLLREVLPVGTYAGANALALVGDREVVVGGWRAAAVPGDRSAWDGFVVRRRHAP